MPSAPRDCGRCGGSLEEGFLLDRSDSGATATHWVEGAPEKSFWTGLSLTGRRSLTLTTWRCRRCGLLESYALD